MRTLMTARVLRRTSLYVLTVPAHVDVHQLVNAMVQKMDENPDIQRAGSWAKDGHAVVMFRTTNDAVAIAVAESLGGNTSGSILHTGLGVHRRNVAIA